MKSVILVRHAKSNWDNMSLQDFDRPLNERGKRDAPEMAKRLVTKGIKIDAFISSPAKRAKKTASLFAAEYHVDKENIVLVPELYLPASDAFVKAILTAPDTAHTIAIFSHNPGITEFANTLTQTRIDDMPTCAVFAVQTDALSWRDFENAKKWYWFFDYPKAV